MADDQTTVRLLLEGDESVFSALVERLHARLVRVCRRFVSDDAMAEDVAQDTWQAVLQGLTAFDGRCALDTWIVQIAINRAKTKGVREARADSLDDDGLAGRFSFIGSWREAPRGLRLDATSERAASNRELIRLVLEAIDALPAQQRLVVSLRDIEGLTASEVCAALELSEENQRVLLHRGRTRLRAALELAIDAPASQVLVA